MQWMPERTEAMTKELNREDARYGGRCWHLKKSFIFFFFAFFFQAEDGIRDISV